jgi:hypothetical protein
MSILDGLRLMFGDQAAADFLAIDYKPKKRDRGETRDRAAAASLS